MQNRASLYRNFLFFGLAIPIIVLSSIVYGGAAFWQVRFVYPAIFLLGFLTFAPRFLEKQPLFCSKTSYYLFIALAGFFFLCLLQLVFLLLGWPSVLATQSAPETYLALPRVLAHILLFFYFYETFKSPRRIRIFFGVLIIITMILFYLGLSKSVLPPNWFPFYNLLPEAFASTFQYKNAFAFFVNLIYPFALATTLHEGVLLTHSRSFAEAIKRLFLSSFVLKIVGVLLMVLSVVISRSKGGIIALTIVSLFVLLFVFLLELRKGSSRAFSFLAILAFLALLSWGVFKLFGFHSPLKQTIGGFSYIFQQLAGFSASDRTMVTQTVLKAVAEYPLFGFGLGSFRDIFSHYQPASVWRYYLNAHNDYAELLFNTGYLGFTLLLVVPATLAVRCVINTVRNLPRYSTDTLILIVGMLGGLLSAMIHSFSDFSLTYPASMFVFTALAGAFFALTEEKSAEPSITPTSNSKRIGFILFAVTVLAAFLAFATQEFSKDYSNHGKYKESHRLNPFVMVPQFGVLRQELNAESTSLADDLKEADRLSRLAPNGQTYYELGNILLETGHLDEAVTFFDKAYAWAPAHRWYYFKKTLKAYLSILNINQDNWEARESYLNKIEELVISISGVVLDLTGGACWELWQSTISDMVKNTVKNTETQKKVLEIIQTKYTMKCY